MSDQISESKIVLASGNPGKVREINQLLADQSFDVISQKEFATPEAEETGLTFIENAILKARNAALHCHLPAIADDSGIEVDALNGKPGIYSARFAGPDCNDQDNNVHLLKLLRDTPESERTARFQCVMVYLKHAEDPTPIICQGTWEGIILKAPQGENGFGYDPLFWVPSQDCTSAELAPGLKNQLSHRGQALRQLLKVLT